MGRPATSPTSPKAGNLNQYRRMRADQGLTLIELLIVIVILGILSAIIVLSVEGITDRGEAASCEATAQTVRIASEAYYAQNGTHAASLQALETANFLSTLPAGTSGNVITTTGGGTITYDPATGNVTDTCPAVGTGGSGGGGGGPSVAAATGPNGLVLEGGGGGGVADGGINTTNGGFPCNLGSGDCLDGSEPITVYLSGDCDQITNATVSFTGITGSPVVLSGSGCTRTATLSSGYGSNTWPEGSGPVSGTITISPGSLGGPFAFTVETG